MTALLLRDATLPDGTSADVLCRDGKVVEVGPHLVAPPDADIAQLGGRLLLPAAAEPHAHLDKAFLAERIENRTGDLLGAITAMERNRKLLNVADTAERAERAVRLMVANGATAIRTHADLTEAHGLHSIEALSLVRERVSDVCDLQIVALAGWPITGPDGAGNRALLRDALAAGVDLVGGCPHLDPEPAGANEVLLELAAAAGRPVDLHTDETLDPQVLALEDLAERVVASGFPHPVTASHCVSLGMQPDEVQHRVAAKVAAAGIGVVALPHTNLYLQGRDHQQAMPRGLTAVRALRAAGVTVAAGADNLQDPFNPLGRADPFETAGLMVLAAHLSPVEAYTACSGDARRVMHLPPAGPSVGQRADLVAVPSATVREAIAFGPGGRIVIRRGRVVAAP
jgi:cytosine deaminase